MRQMHLLYENAPVTGASYDAANYFNQGQYLNSAGAFLLGLADLFTLGEISAFIKTGTSPLTSLLTKKTLTSKSTKTSTKLINQFSTKTIDDAVGLVMKDPNKTGHLFNPKHNLGELVSKLGGQENTVRAVLNAANGKLPASGVFNNIPVSVSGQTIFLRG